MFNPITQRLGAAYQNGFLIRILHQEILYNRQWNKWYPPNMSAILKKKKNCVI